MNEGRITKVEVMKDGAWATIDPDATYGVVTNNFLRSGGDGYVTFAENAMNAYDFGPSVEDVVVDYLQANGPYTPYMDGRIIQE